MTGLLRIQDSERHVRFFFLVLAGCIEGHAYINRAQASSLQTLRIQGVRVCYVLFADAESQDVFASEIPT